MSEVLGLDKFLKHVAEFPTAVNKFNREQVNKSAFIVKQSVNAELGGVSFLSGVGRKGAKIGVRYDIKGGQNPTALVRAFGPFQLIERDTKAHEIPRANRRRKRGSSGRPVLAIGDEVITGPVQHPGTKGKHPWEKGVTRALPLVKNVYRAEGAKLMGRVFGR